VTRLFNAWRRGAASPARADATAPLSDAPASKIRYLRATDIFRDLSPTEMAELDRMTALITCPRGRVIFTPGQTGEVLFVLKKGRVHLYRLTADGRKLVTATFEGGTVFGEMSFIGQGMGGSFAEAADDCTLCVMGRADVERLLLAYPKVALRLVELLAARLAQAEERLETLAFKRAASRVAAALLSLADERGDIVGVSHQEIGEQVGAFRETTTRILNDFRARGWIELHRLRIRIRDPEGLRRVTEE
jgi:CRP/FNR family cyclic AMP-dependent transcriptional regulator